MGDDAIAYPELVHALALFERRLGGLEAALRDPEIEDVQTFAFEGASAQAFAFRPSVPDTDPIEIEAWVSSAAQLAVVLLDGNFTQAEVAALIADNSGSGFVAILASVPSGGVARIRRASYSGHLTVANLVAPAHTALVTVKVSAK
jgi:hypothetical protein